MNRLLDGILRRVVKDGRLEVIWASGEKSHYGEGSRAIGLVFADSATPWGLALDPDLAIGEAFMDGRLRVENGCIYDLLELLTRNAQAASRPGWMAALDGLRIALRRLHQRNGRRRARRNVAHHYDLDLRLYRLFLDADLQYSCAYFPRDGMSLEEAQRAKKQHIAAKLALAPGQRVLDIGSGWGGLALSLAGWADVEVTGITLSSEQQRLASRRAAQAGHGDRVQFLVRDYRELSGPFDRIVSVGMFEHVGIGHYDGFFRACRDLLTDQGVMLLHSIGRFDGPSATNPWVHKYIFPGGYIPALSEILPAVERAGLLVADMEILRLHYAETLSAWRERFLAHCHEAAAIYDERFCRMWEYYLAGSELAFRQQSLMVFQLQLVKDQAVLPLTRDYMRLAEAALTEADRAEPAVAATGQRAAARAGPSGAAAGRAWRPAGVRRAHGRGSPPTALGDRR